MMSQEITTYMRGNKILPSLFCLMLVFLSSTLPDSSAEEIYKDKNEIDSSSTAVTSGFAVHPAENTLSLQGIWHFALDPDNVGTKERWFARSLHETIILPGTTDENKKGVFKNKACDDRLSRVYYWKGTAWYQRQVTIPENWANKHIVLYLERTKDVKVWVDETFCGHGNSLSTPQVYDLSDYLAPGIHRLTILVDNAKLKTEDI